jgi:hypothetical protein
VNNLGPGSLEINIASVSGAKNTAKNTAKITAKNNKPGSGPVGFKYVRGSN